MSSVNLLKSSLFKSYRASIIAKYPFIEPYMDNIIHKKDPLKLAKW